MKKEKKILWIVGMIVTLSFLGSFMDLSISKAKTRTITATKKNISQSKKDAWKLFKKNIGFEIDYVKSDSEGEIAEYICKQLEKEYDISVPPRYGDNDVLSFAADGKKGIKSFKQRLKIFSLIDKDVKERISKYKIENEEYISKCKLTASEIQVIVFEDYINEKVTLVKSGAKESAPSFSNKGYRQLYNGKLQADYSTTKIMLHSLVVAMGWEYYYDNSGSGCSIWDVCVKVKNSVDKKYYRLIAIGNDENSDFTMKKRKIKNTFLWRDDEFTAPLLSTDYYEGEVLTVYGEAVSSNSNIIEVIETGKNKSKLKFIKAGQVTITTSYGKMERNVVMQVKAEETENVIQEESPRHPPTLTYSIVNPNVEEGSLMDITVYADQECTFTIDNGATIYYEGLDFCSLYISKNGTYTVTATNRNGFVTTYTFTITGFYNDVSQESVMGKQGEMSVTFLDNMHMI